VRGLRIEGEQGAVAVAFHAVCRISDDGRPEFDTPPEEMGRRLDVGAEPFEPTARAWWVAGRAAADAG